MLYRDKGEAMQKLLILASILLLVGCGGESESKTKFKSLTAAQRELIQNMESQGMLTVDGEINRAEIDPTLWAGMKHSLKEDFSVALGIHCGNIRKNDMYYCTIYDMYSGKKLAKYNSWGFETY